MNGNRKKKGKARKNQRSKVRRTKSSTVISDKDALTVETEARKDPLDSATVLNTSETADDNVESKKERKEVKKQKKVDTENKINTDENIKYPKKVKEDVSTTREDTRKKETQIDI